MGTLDVARSWVGLKWPDPRFRAIVEPYWQPGYGSSCMVVVTGVLAAAGVRPEHLNRGPNWIPGDHMRPLIARAKQLGAFHDAPSPGSLRPGDAYFLQRPTADDADHAGIVERNNGDTIDTIDGGQADERGNQLIARRRRTVKGNTLALSQFGLPPRVLAWRIDAERLAREDSRNPPKGEKVDSSAISAYLDQVEADWDKTSRAVAKQQAESITGHAPPLPFSRFDFLQERNEWRKWYLWQKDEWWLEDDVYTAAKEWHAKQKVWADMLASPPKGQTSVPKEKPKEPGGIGIGGGILAVGAIAVGAAYFAVKGEVKRGRSERR
jgi:hypothetical protein